MLYLWIDAKYHWKQISIFAIMLYYLQCFLFFSIVFFVFCYFIWDLSSKNQTEKFFFHKRKVFLCVLFRNVAVAVFWYHLFVLLVYCNFWISFFAFEPFYWAALLVKRSLLDMVTLIQKNVEIAISKSFSAGAEGEKRLLERNMPQKCTYILETD